MPKKLIKMFGQVVVGSGGFSVALSFIDCLEALRAYGDLVTVKVVVWLLFVLFMAWKIRQIYIGYRDGTFFNDLSNSR